MGFFQQLRLLLWKNVLLQRRAICVSIFEILIPLFFAVIILIVRSEAKSDGKTYPTFYPNESVHQKNFTYRYMGEYLELGYVPNTPLAASLMVSVLDRLTKNLDLSKVNSSGIKGFDNEEELVSYFRLKADQMQLAVVFVGLAEAQVLPKEVTYYIRPITGEDSEWYTSLTYPFLHHNVPSAIGPDYDYSGVLLLQTVVSEVLVRTWSNKTLIFDLTLQRMPFPPYVTDPIITVLDTTFPLLLMLSFILSVVANSKSIVYEKEHKLKESMKLMGLLPSAHWVSWFITCYVYLAVAMAIYAVLFGINIVKAKGPVLTHSNPGLFYVFLLLYAAAIVSFCFMVSVLVQKANVAAAVGGILFFAFYFPQFFLASRYQDLTKSEKIGACFLFNMAMAFGAKVFSLSEGTGEGANWDNFYKPASVDDDFCLLDAMAMLLADTAIHLIITWYIENVRPGRFGVPRPFYFPFTRAYWCRLQASTSESYVSSKPDADLHFEREPSDFEPCIRICNLRKTYTKNKVAVEGMNLTMYKGQITVLLGHNGAGKTTTMSMLTGFATPTSGTAYVNGLDIRTDMSKVRKSLGLCPQHNILFGLLTVEEHLEFFARLKGCPSKDVKQEVERTIKEIGLEAKAEARAATLSGGQKRKLSVGIALINGSQVVVLDEPTSGMDPAARRQTWDVLKKQREGRCMLLTTHYMDEADVLGDRIAIMAEGVVKCCGSSLFLKKLYGAGYHLVLVRASDCKVAKITETIQGFLPSARFDSEVNMELTYLLPADQSHVFPALFTVLEDRREELRILSFGATATTMEEVFLRVGQSAVTDPERGIVNKPQTDSGHTNPAFDNEQTATSHAEALHFHSMREDAENATSDVLDFTRGYQRASGRQLQRARLKALVVKKAIHFWRNRLITLAQLFLPVVFAVFALSIDKAKPMASEQPPLEWSLEPFAGTHVLYGVGPSDDNVSETLAKAYATQFDELQTLELMVLGPSDVSSYLLERTERVGIATFNKKFIVGAVFEQSSSDEVKAVALYNGQPFHSKAIALHYVLNALVRKFVGEEHRVKAGIHPLPADEEVEAKRASLVTSLSGFSVGLVLSFGMAFLTTMFIYFLIVERTCGAKHLQVVSGVRPLMYWLSNLLWDYTIYLLPCLGVLIVFAAFGTDVYVEDKRLGLVFLVLLDYGWAVLPLMYVAHFIFSSAATGVVVVIVFNIFSGVITMVTVFVLKLPALGLEKLSNKFDWAFLVVFPNHCLSRSFMDIYSNKRNQEICMANVTLTARNCLFAKGPCCKNIGRGCPDNVCLEYTDSFLSWEEPGVGRFLTFMAVQGAAYFCLLLLVERRVLQAVWDCLQCGYAHRLRSVDNQRQFSFLTGAAREDSDVAEERRRINASPASVLSQKDPLLLVNLYKTFRGFAAVDHVCVGVPEHECFGLLGQNGAGKTTIFKMLTGDVMVTGGNAYLKGNDVKSRLEKVLESFEDMSDISVQADMGYCPQFDAVLDQMTGRETLTMYARLRGVPEQSIRGVVNSLIDILMLRPHADKLAGHYSGGNKRKLSIAIALIGDPPFLLLDEPSSGMDPAARRQLWTVLSKIRASGRTLVLTSHSMEECDALCTRIAIMVNGNFLCLGSPQHLKSKFGQGYSLVAQMAVQAHGVPADYAPFVAYIQACCQGALVFDCHQGYVHMQVPDPCVRLVDVFTWMEHSKIYLGVQDYSVHQTTLEQIFLAFTRSQVPPRKKKKKKCCSKRKCCCLCCCR